MGRAERFEGAEYRTSSHSQPHGSCCAEVALSEAVGVRDSRVTGGTTVAFERTGWARLIDGLTGLPTGRHE
ncbi:DUF397 domain-containing protein [Streptomyces bohaiensis]|uniref:DUF397 domain-containing protein n=1 Tax=Streptomyces bohaiensis TaxID=1431344 RepID=A0ABX1CAY9_9ACTN|nr:DUF397 domain-containing protein [Streptomyces bohaiensis]NJQ15050.1 DUF397 domain-containing protein [Streptomyces bohaiensis]